MKVEIYTNKYGYERVKCPFCSIECFWKGTKKENGLQRHIALGARDEAFRVALGDIVDTPHLTYYKANTKQKVVPSITTREFTDTIETTPLDSQ